MNSKSIVGIIVILLILIGGYFFVVEDTNNEDQPLTSTPTPVTPGQNTATPTPPANQDENATSGDQVRTVTIRYTDQGFTPADITISKGDTVTWVNETTGTMWVASDVHPTHVLYSGTNRSAHCPDTANTTFDQCENGSDFSFTFDKVGAWEYHNHSRANFTGTVNVTQ